MNQDKFQNLYHEISNYYSNKITQYGSSHLGVDWNSTDSQYLRFAQLTKLLPQNEIFSITDVGCGYGALIDFLNQYYNNFEYVGIDVSPQMIASAKELFPKNNFICSNNIESKTDYIVASGIFNVKQNSSSNDWLEFIQKTLFDFNECSTKGFSFNCLTSYSDKEYMKDYLYYTDPCQIFDFCKRNFSKNVALLHDYNLYEFTILVRK